MTDEQILQLAKTCGFRNDFGWECWEEQLLEFAWEIYGIASDETLQDYESKF